jgi:hypothetical protein
MQSHPAAIAAAPTPIAHLYNLNPATTYYHFKSIFDF